MNNVNQEYHNYLKWILTDENSVYKTSRAGGTIANSGATMKFDLSQSFPLINTKEVFYRGVIHEMVWFMHGPEKYDQRKVFSSLSTNEKLLYKFRKLANNMFGKEDVGEMYIDYLIDNTCNFWNKDLHQFNSNKSGIKFGSVAEREEDFKTSFKKELLNNPVFRAKMGSLGRPYGAQWRDWKGADGKSYDQLANAFDEIRKHSDSRRIIVEAWKVDELKNMGLPPCHKTFQFLVMNDRLDIDIEQRSADSFLGVVFNSMQYGLMGMLGSEYSGLKPGVLTHHLVDAHIYCGVGAKAEWYKKNLPELKARLKEASRSEDYLAIKDWIDTKSEKDPNPMYEKFDHVTAVLEQLSRDVNKYPIASLEVIIDKSKSPKELLDTISFDNFKVVGYEGNHYDKIIREMPTG